MTRPSTHLDYPNLDFLRTVAVLCVYAFHLSLTFGHRLAIDLGHVGVLLFFVHTSLVLMMSLDRLAARHEPLFASFYLRRFFRIYPLSIACVLLVVLGHLPRAPWWPYAPPDLPTLAANLLLCMNLVYATPVTSVLWSLPYEVQMYLLLPLLYLFGRRFGARGAAAIWLIAAIAGATLPLLSDRLDFFAFGPCFIAGVLAFFTRYGSRAPTLPAWCWPVVLAAGAALFHLGNINDHRRIAGWGMCLLVGAAAPFCREFSAPALRGLCAAIAKYSYGIYLTHIYAMWVAFVVLKSAPAPAQWATLAVLSVGVPVLLFHALEQPFIRFGAACADRLPRSAGTARPLAPPAT